MAKGTIRRQVGQVEMGMYVYPAVSITWNWAYVFLAGQMRAVLLWVTISAWFLSHTKSPLAREDALSANYLVKRSYNDRKQAAQALALFGAPEPSQRGVDSFSAVRTLSNLMLIHSGVPPLLLLPARWYPILAKGLKNRAKDNSSLKSSTKQPHRPNESKNLI